MNPGGISYRMTDNVNIRDDALPGKGQPTDMVPVTQDVRATDRV